MTEYRIYIAKNCFAVSNDDELYKIVDTHEKAARCCDEHNDNEVYPGKKEYYYFMKHEF